MFSFQLWTAVVVASCLTVFALSYYFSVSTFGKWRKLGVPYVRPVPLFGNFTSVALGIDHAVHLYRTIYHELAGRKYGGFFQMRTPYLMVRDPEMINDILVKDFSYFSDRGIYSDLATNPLSGGLFFTDNPQWRIVRNRLSPAFASGRLKSMDDSMKECSDQLIERVRNDVMKFGGDIEVRDVIGNYSMDTIGACMFGLKFNAVNDSASSICKYSKVVFKPALRVLLRELCLMITPALLKLVKLKDFPSDATAFFQSIFYDTLEYRKRNNIKRDDVLDILIGARNDLVLNSNSPPNERVLETHLVGNAFLMFSAGFETIATTITCCLYELALKKHLQDRVREEIGSKLSKHDGFMSNEFLSDLPYLDMVLQETLRKYTPTFGIFRQATKTYQVRDDSLIIEKGQKIVIPVHSLHYDPRYFKDPEVFDPERFTPEEKAKRPRSVYLPFGEGPRYCIGKRFVNLEMKIALAKIISKFEVEPCEKTVVPLTFAKMVIFLIPDRGIWLKFKPINN